MEVDLGPYPNLLLVVAAQLAWFVVVAAAVGKIRDLHRPLVLGLAAGTPMGLIFDFSVGKVANIFHYRGLEAEYTFLILNAALSYGVAIATVLLVPARSMPRYTGRLRGIALAAAISVLGLGLALPTETWPPLAAMFILGGIIVLFFEALALVIGRTGYLAQSINRKSESFTRIWVFSSITGIVYESANYLFPLWSWVNKYPSETANLVLVVSLGYFVLFFPVFIVQGLFISNRKAHLRTPRIV